MEIPQDVTNRELAILIKSLDDKNELAHKEMMEKVTSISQQTAKTNGRVSRLELWRSGIVSVIALISFAIPLLISYLK